MFSLSNTSSSNEVKKYSCNNYETKESQQIPENKVAEIALTVIQQNGEIEFRFDEISSKLSFYEKISKNNYTVDFKFVENVKALADNQGIAVARREIYSSGQLIGGDYGLTGVKLIKI